MLKRHLMTDHKLTPEQYRQRWELPFSYPLVAPNYAKTRSAWRRSLGLGRKGQAALKKEAEEKPQGERQWADDAYAPIAGQPMAVAGLWVGFK